ncbi:MAG: hypothetical protein PUB21_12605 [Bacteroidales bacterium]|nr:hypothetical protein [Bacteroidales bacterium]
MMKFFAHLFSTLFHPLLMITYGVLFALNFTMLQFISPTEKILLLGGTFFFSAFLPALVIAIMIWLKWISDYEVDKREERPLPYIVSIISYVATLWFLVIMWAPYWLLGLVGGAIASLLVGMSVNMYWKISAHGIGVGGFAGCAFAITPLLISSPLPLFAGILIISGLVCTSRLILKRHTLGQVLCGFLLGFIFSNIGIFLSYYIINKN